jgi:hypothetical protein
MVLMSARLILVIIIMQSVLWKWPTAG